MANACRTNVKEGAASSVCANSLELDQLNSLTYLAEDSQLATYKLKLLFNIK